MSRRHRRSFLNVIVFVAVCFLLSGIGYAKNNTLPAKYPDEWGVIFGKAKPLKEVAFPSIQHNAFTGFNPGRTIYRKGTVVYEGGPELQCDIICDRDVAVAMRDRKKIYIDIFRPANTTEKVPAILAYGVYGKGTPRKPMAEIPAGDGDSGLAKFEAPDPGFYCRHGYAVINVDARGTNMSEGDSHCWGSVVAGDGYDLIEWVAEQEWSNGKVGMGGRSWLGICQWYIAATQPPHLTALAPFGAHFFDQYRYDVCVGGIPMWRFNKFVTDDLMGKNLAEHPYEMIQKYALMNPYWENKVAKIENIKIPIYSVGGYSGDLEGARALMGPQTWLRIQSRGNTNDDDLLRFFDRYLKGIENGWETTPRVRVTVTDPGGLDQINRPETNWPLPQTVYTQLFLNSAKGTLSTQPATSSSVARYDAKEGQITFTITFQEDTELTGYTKLVIWVEADEADDMDIFVSVQKVDFLGNAHNATSGQQRVSLRELDPEKTLSYIPVHTFRERELLSRGQIVPVEIRISPMGMLWHKGEQLRLTIGGDKFGINGTNFMGMSSITHSYNKGYHIIHTGPQYPSYLQVPVIPER